MTERKPPGVSWESWIDQQIHKAREEGAFDNLPGAGKPLPDLDQGYDPDWWVKKLVRREGVSLLPPALELTRKVEAELARIWTLRSEGEVRIRVSALNAEIAKVNATAAEGPSTRLAPLDVERLVQEWRRRAAAPEWPPSAEGGRNRA
jgi:Domain of unknown function (DUF1992)